MIEKVNPMHPDKIADRIAGAIVDLKVMNEGVRAVGDILHWLVSGPAIILIAISSITTLKEI